MAVPHDDEKVTYFGQTDSRGKRRPFGIKNKDRSRHMYVIGKTGMGKSTLLENMAIQDIQNGHGIAFIDPHGKTADLLLEYIPAERIKDVLYFAPFDMEYPVSFNVMEDIGYDKRHLVANGLMSTFEKIWEDAWSARMAYILNNTLLALLEYPGATLLGINRMLSDKDYRKKVVDNVKDPSVKSFWIDEFGKYTERFAAEATPAIQNKVGQFTSNPLIRNIIGQEKSAFDIRKIMDEGKILIVNLSKGLVGEGNANLIGSMLITKIYLAAMSRADVPTHVLHKLPNFFLFVDEFQSFANKSFADILSEARKYKLNLIMAHQYIEQMSEEVRAGVFGNVGTMVTFRVGAYDAEVLEKEFAPQFTAEDLVNLGMYQTYLKLMIDGVTSPPFSAMTMAPIEKTSATNKEEIIAMSRKQFARPRAVVEADILEWHQAVKPQAKAPVSSADAAGPRPAARRDERGGGHAPSREHAVSQGNASGSVQSAGSSSAPHVRTPQGTQPASLERASNGLPAPGMHRSDSSSPISTTGPSRPDAIRPAVVQEEASSSVSLSAPRHSQDTSLVSGETASPAHPIKNHSAKPAEVHQPFREKLSLSSLKHVPKPGEQGTAFKKPEDKEKQVRNLSELRKALAAVLPSQPAGGQKGPVEALPHVVAEDTPKISETASGSRPPLSEGASADAIRYTTIHRKGEPAKPVAVPVESTPPSTSQSARPAHRSDTPPLSKEEEARAPAKDARAESHKKAHTETLRPEESSAGAQPPASSQKPDEKHQDASRRLEREVPEHVLRKVLKVEE